MGFLKRIFRNVFRDGMPRARIEQLRTLTEEQLEAHLRFAATATSS